MKKLNIEIKIDVEITLNILNEIKYIINTVNNYIK